MANYKTVPQCQRHLQPQIFEANDGISETVQNQALSVEETLLRFSQGTLNNIVQPVYYNDEDNNDNFDNYDITDNPAFDLVDADNFKTQVANKREYDKKTKLSTIQNEETPQKTPKPSDSLQSEEKAD